MIKKKQSLRPSEVREKQLARLQAIRNEGEAAARAGKDEYRDNPYDPYAALGKNEDYLDSEACAAETWVSGWRYARRAEIAAQAILFRKDLIW